ncbi:hypothetical protein ACFWY6_10180 [Streptomyces sp. NPDC059037]|uniref:hypothetical protein n=1 Tax=Streptomyces sp. NPDC059037 TaxID=3346710 RepID=UPI00368E34A7
MAGSSRPKRRRATPSALPVEPRTPRPRQERKPAGRKGKKTKDKSAMSWPQITACVLGVMGAAVGTFFWTAPLWAGLAPHWPAEGYGFAVTVGLLLPAAIALMAMAAMRTKQSAAQGRAGLTRASGWALTTVTAYAASTFLAGLQFGAIKPKRRNRDADCYESGGACWISEHYPLAWLLGILAIPVGIVLIMWLSGRFGDAKKQTSPA